MLNWAGIVSSGVLIGLSVGALLDGQPMARIALQVATIIVALACLAVTVVRDHR